MTQGDEQHVKRIFQAAVERDPSERPAFLAQACAGDAALRATVESLLAAAESADSFLDRPPEIASDMRGGVDRSAASQLPTTSDSAPFAPAQVIGRYRLLEPIGEGGMGEVWLADQLEPVRRKVALKVVKAGLDTRQFIARFEAERQALALMEHPTIAKVFDAGATPAGRPYFVMEYVAGEPITKHCDRHRFSIHERLELFMQVCDGVQHAHQKAVLHRDLKPSNVLVSLQDGVAVPKIIDFGVAKAMAQPLTARTLYTAMGMIVGTPGYMSPEQADFSGHDVDSRSDVYSLGVMLYEMLVGTIPIDQQRLRGAGWEGLGRLLREEEPSPPSRRLAILSPESAAAAASHRQTDVAALRRRLAGDLDWIAMKAIDHDRTRRYGSPAELAEEIRRHLRDEPVLAGPPSTAYRMHKFVRRHRVSVAVAGVVALAAGGGLIGTSFGLVRARRAEAKAEAEAETSKRHSAFLAGVLASVDPGRMGQALVADLRERVAEAEKARTGADPQIAARLESFDQAILGVNRVDVARRLMDQEILARAGRTIEEEVSGEPLLAARLQATLGAAYHHLGLFVSAASYHLKAVETRRRLLGPEHPETLASMTDLGQAYYSSGHAADAVKVLQEALDAQRRVLGPEHPQTLHSMNHLGFATSFVGDQRGAEALYRETLQIRRRVLGDDHLDTTNTMRFLADTLTLQGRAAEAEQLYREALDIQRRVLGPEHTETLRTMGNMARAYIALGRFADAERLSLEVIGIRQRLDGDDNLLTVLSLGYLGMGYVREGRHADAERVLSEAIVRSRRGESQLVTALYAETLAESYKAQGRLAEAEGLFREGLAIRRVNAGEHGIQLTPDLLALAEVVTRLGRPREAEPLHLEALEIHSRVLGEDHPGTLWTLSALARLYLEMGEAGKARSRVVELLARRKRAAEGSPSDPAARHRYAHDLLTCEPSDLRDPEGALQVALAAAAATKRQDPAILTTLALAYRSLGSQEEAEQTRKEALALLPEGPSPLRTELERSVAAPGKSPGR